MTNQKVDYYDRVVVLWARPFSSEPKARRVEVHLDLSGQARVFDSVAGHWTTCHRLSERERLCAYKKGVREGYAFNSVCAVAAKIGASP